MTEQTRNTEQDGIWEALDDKDSRAFPLGRLHIVLEYKHGCVRGAR